MVVCLDSTQMARVRISYSAPIYAIYSLMVRRLTVNEYMTVQFCLGRPCVVGVIDSTSAS